MTKESEFTTVVFDVFDLLAIAVFAERQRCVKRHGKIHSRKYDKSKTEFELHYIGAMGEFALQKLFPETIIDYEVYDIGDSGIDVVLWGHRIQVKTRFFRGAAPHAMLLFDNLDEFKAPVAVCVQVTSPVQACILGCISRDLFELRAKTRDFGYGPRLYVPPEELTAVSVLKDRVPHG